MTTSLPREAVDLLTAVRDALDLPLYREGSKKARRAYLDRLALRAQDVVTQLDAVLAVPAAGASAAADTLREQTAGPVGYATHLGGAR